VSTSSCRGTGPPRTSIPVGGIASLIGVPR
jgi:hypothetical protein